MFAGVDISYQYDGSFDGLLCCIFEGFRRHECPAEILPLDSPSFYPVRQIITDERKAERVLTGLARKISLEAAELLQLGFLTCVPERERLLFDFVCRAFDFGPKIADHLQDDVVHRLKRAVRHMREEAHLLMGFTRFSEQNGVLAAVISPKNHALFLMQEHFCNRFSAERFLIYDKTHREALIYQPFKWVIVPMEQFFLPQPDEREREYQQLWRNFYDTVAIRERENPGCRMTHCPKRYWENMTELKAELPAGPPELSTVEQPLPRRDPFIPPQKIPQGMKSSWWEKGPLMPYPGSRAWRENLKQRQTAVNGGWQRKLTQDP